MTSGNENLHAKKQGSLLGFFKPQKMESTVSDVVKTELEAIPSAIRNETKAAKVIDSKVSPSSVTSKSSDCSSSFTGSSSESDTSSEMSEESCAVGRKRKKTNSVAPSAKKREILSECQVDDAFLFDPLAIPSSEPVSRSLTFHTAPEEEGTYLSSEEIDKLCVGVPAFIVTLTHYYYELSSRFDFPSWFNPKSIRDIHNRRPTDPEYDVSTVLIPRKNGKVVEEGHSTPMLQQYWSIKEDHFDEIILFKVGKFYELFYMDAAIAQPICNLKWMGHDRRAHVGFPEVSLQHHSYTLLQHGYTVCVVEQTETVNEANERSSLAGGRKTALVERKICEMFTSGTLVHEEMLRTADAHYLVAISGSSLVAVDCASGAFRLFSRLDDSRVATLLATLQPREILVAEDLKFAAVASKVVKWKQWEGRGVPPTLLVDEDVRELVEADRNLKVAVNGVVNYLNHLLLTESVLMCSSWTIHEAIAAQSTVLDATVLSHLEILRDSEGGTRGSLLAYLDQTATPFGSRAMREWLCAPLQSVAAIEERASAVESFVNNPSLRKSVWESLKKLPDLERRLQRICSLAMQQARGAVFFHEAENKKIALYLQFLDAVSAVLPLLDSLGFACPLRESEIADFRAVVVETKTKTFVPRPGAFAAYDAAGEELQAIDAQLANILAAVKKSVSRDAVFVHTKYKNEIEIPQDKEKEISSAEITSSRKGFVRFRTDEIKTLVEARELVEEKMTDLMYPFMSLIFSGIAKKRIEFSQVIQRVANLDCLVALARVSSQPNWVRPVWTGTRKIDIRESRHPVQEQLLALAGKDFVPNDIALNGNTILVTGANMGGKSTILRQTCIAVILAQMGCFVPAASCTFAAPIDRIFTRIGASDNILEGKSTFLTELEETATILREATGDSLVVIDELGRGTSTFDGVAIAGATLQFIVDKIKCSCLFATHYHRLAREPNIQLFHMECLQENGAVELTHKFKQGPYPHSQAMHVAKLAGIPESILAEAESVSKRFEETHNVIGG